MILTLDVGNTNITFGVYDKEELVTTFRITTKIARTSDEYGILIRDLLRMNDVNRADIEGSIVASVVPNIMHSLTGAMVRYIGSNPLIVGPGTKTGIQIKTKNPREIGADRVVDAVAAYEKYGGPVLVLDFGTATTYDYVSADGSLMAGVTAPGIRISAAALSENAAKLPKIEIKKPESILAGDTVTSMQAGIMYGQIGQTEYIIRQMKKETGCHDMKVVATGGLGRSISQETDMIDIYDKTLTLDGLRIIFEKNRS
ncbi:MAG: type III pantothenate kinase [Lachnospiraceae bacterium]|nr:type III pantothenate kinase [Lachnospiraceae bacterium]